MHLNWRDHEQLHSPSQALRWRSLASFSGCSAVSFTVLSASTFSSSCFLFSCISVTLSYRRDSILHLPKFTDTIQLFFLKLQYIQEIIHAATGLFVLDVSKYECEAFWQSWTDMFVHTKQVLPAFLAVPSWLPQWAAVSGESPLWWSQPSSAEPPSLYVPVPWEPIKHFSGFVYIVTVLNHK